MRKRKSKETKSKEDSEGREGKEKRRKKRGYLVGPPSLHLFLPLVFSVLTAPHIMPIRSVSPSYHVSGRQHLSPVVPSSKRTAATTFSPTPSLFRRPFPFQTVSGLSLCSKCPSASDSSQFRFPSLSFSTVSISSSSHCPSSTLPIVPYRHLVNFDQSSGPYPRLPQSQFSSLPPQICCCLPIPTSDHPFASSLPRVASP